MTTAYVLGIRCRIIVDAAQKHGIDPPETRADRLALTGRPAPFSPRAETRDRRRAAPARVPRTLARQPRGSGRTVVSATAAQPRAGAATRAADDARFARYFAAIKATVASSMRLLKPHSLSYQLETLTRRPATFVSVASKMLERGSWLKSLETRGSAL